MTKEEYFKAQGSVIGLCELCIHFDQCAKEETLEKDACKDHSYIFYDEE